MSIPDPANIPSALWTAAIAFVATLNAGGMSLAGVVLTNRDARKRLAKQLEHDSTERTREREMALRRDVYLEAAANIARVSHIMGRLANVGDETAAQELGDTFAALARVQLTGSNETVHAVMAMLTLLVLAEVLILPVLPGMALFYLVGMALIYLEHRAAARRAAISELSSRPWRFQFMRSLARSGAGPLQHPDSIVKEGLSSNAELKSSGSMVREVI